MAMIASASDLPPTNLPAAINGLVLECLYKPSGLPATEPWLALPLAPPVADDPLSLEPTELADLRLSQPGRFDQVQEVAVEIGLAPEHVVGPDLALLLSQNEAIGGNHKLADRRIGPMFAQDKGDHGQHLPAGSRETIWPQLGDELIFHRIVPMLTDAHDPALLGLSGRFGGLGLSH